jgi:hypothetical protein
MPRFCEILFNQLKMPSFIEININPNLWTHYIIQVEIIIIIQVDNLAECIYICRVTRRIGLLLIVTLSAGN